MYKNIFGKRYTEHWSRKIFAVNSVLKTNSWTCKIKDLIREKIIESTHTKYFLLSKL